MLTYVKRTCKLGKERSGFNNRDPAGAGYVKAKTPAGSGVLKLLAGARPARAGHFEEQTHAGVGVTETS